MNYLHNIYLLSCFDAKWYRSLKRWTHEEGVTHLHHFQNDSSCPASRTLTYHALRHLQIHVVVIETILTKRNLLTGRGSNASSNPSPLMCECAPAFGK